MTDAKDAQPAMDFATIGQEASDLINFIDHGGRGVLPHTLTPAAINGENVQMISLEGGTVDGFYGANTNVVLTNAQAGALDNALAAVVTATGNQDADATHTAMVGVVNLENSIFGHGWHAIA